MHADYIQHTLIKSLSESKFSSRVGVFSLRQHWETGGDLYIHSKVMIIDDKWFTIGSANTNPRSFKLDGEVNIVVRDDLASRHLRLELWKEHMQAVEKLMEQFDITNAKKFVQMWTTIAKANQNRYRLKERAIIHDPPKGKKLEIPFYIRWIMPDPDQFVMGEFQTFPFA